MNKFVSDARVFSGEAPPAFKSGVEGAINKTFLDARKQIARDVLVAVNTGTLSTAAQNVTAGKALLQSFALLGMSRVVDEDDVMRSLLFGDQSLVDANLVTLAYSKSLEKMESDSTEKVRLNMTSVGAERLAGFKTHLTSVLEDIAGGKVRADDRAVSATLQRLDVFRAVLGSTQPLSCSN